MADAPVLDRAEPQWREQIESSPESGTTRRTEGRAPRAQPGDTVARMLRVLAMLPRAPGKITAREIYRRLREEGHVLTTRTIERDLHRLRLVLELELDAKKKPYGWSWDRSVGRDLIE